MYCMNGYNEWTNGQHEEENVRSYLQFLKMAFSRPSIFDAII